MSDDKVARIAVEADVPAENADKRLYLALWDASGRTLGLVYVANSGLLLPAWDNIEPVNTVRAVLRRIEG